MPERDFEQLLIQLDAETEKMRREMRKGRSQVRDFQRKTDRHLDKIDRRFAKLGKAAAGFRNKLAAMAGAAVGAGGLAAVARGAQNAAAEFDALAKAADTRGLSTDFYQTLQLTAEEAGVKQELLNSSLTAFAKRVGEARLGTGALASKLKEYDAGLFEAVKTSESQEEALRLLADAMAREADAADRAQLASSAFSRAGVDMIRILRQGSGVFDRTAAKARELGIIVDEQILRNMEQVNNDFGVATRVIDLQFKQALIAAAPIIKDFAESLASMAQSARIFFENMRPAADRSTFVLQENITQTEAGLREVNTALEELRAKRDALRQQEGGLFSFRDTQLRGVELSIERLLERREELRGMFSENADALARARRNAEALAQSMGAGGDDGDGGQRSVGPFTTETVDTARMWGDQVQRGLGLVQQMQGPMEIFREQMEALKAAHAEGAISADQFARAQRRAALIVANEYVGLAGTVSGALSSVFKESKGVAIASAIINSLQAFTAALANPPGPPFSYAQAAAALASGYAQVRQIQSTNKNSGGGGGTAGASAGGGGAQGAGAVQTRQAVNISLQGSNFSKQSIRDLIGAISEELGDGVELRAA